MTQFRVYSLLLCKFKKILFYRLYENRDISSIFALSTKIVRISTKRRLSEGRDQACLGKLEDGRRFGQQK